MNKAPLTKHVEEGFRRRPVILRARELQREGKTLRTIGTLLAVKWQTLNTWLQLVKHIPNDGTHEHEINAEMCALQTFKIPGRPREVDVKPEVKAAVRANQLLNNRDRHSGSGPEAIRQTFKEGNMSREDFSVFMQRHQAGKPMLTQALRRDLHISPAVTRSFRNPREAWLTHIESPGSLHYMADEETGAMRLIRPGECATIDDATKNFICTVPLERPGDACWEKFKCIVGRWQILLMVDHRTYFVTACVHTARPRGQYRAEDLTTTFHISGKEHGLPRKMFLEKGISKADLIHSTLDLCGVKWEHVNSPHRKVVEFIFGMLWSKLSFLPGQVGRTRGEEADVDAIVNSCKNGATDPRDFFLPLDVVLKALLEVLAEYNAHTVVSPQYGKWVPAEWFKAEAHEHLISVHPDDEWMFAPALADGPDGNGLLVRGSSVTTRFSIMEGLSLQLDFQAPWFCDFSGARLKFRYNPFIENFRAYAVLGEAYGNQKAGARLGFVEQANLHTRVSRKLLGFGDEQDIGLELARKSAQALYRSGFAIRPDGKPGVERHEFRDGIGKSEIAGHDGPGKPAAAPLPNRRSASAPAVQTARTTDSVAALFGG